ncbi:MAG: hypothetical protein QF535_22510 [Anaerolineales bacterium]|nr:hypothetical protein [Anaerolineales bacterium]
MSIGRGSIPFPASMTVEERHKGTLIVSCKFKQADTADSGGNVQVWATYSTGVEEKLFAYFSDEISFDALELIGKSKQEALDFRHKRDVEYLQAP